jgi:hypothetical protein
MLLRVDALAMMYLSTVGQGRHFYAITWICFFVTYSAPFASLHSPYIISLSVLRAIIPLCLLFSLYTLPITTIDVAFVQSSHSSLLLDTRITVLINCANLRTLHSPPPTYLSAVI